MSTPNRIKKSATFDWYLLEGDIVEVVLTIAGAEPQSKFYDNTPEGWIAEGELMLEMGLRLRQH